MGTEASGRRNPEPRRANPAAGGGAGPVPLPPFLSPTMRPRQAEVSIPLQPPGAGATPASDPVGQPRDYVLWSLFNVLLGYGLSCFGCFCFPALIYSIKARDCKVLGDVEGARQHGARAKALNIICSVLLVLILLVITICIIGAIVSTTI
ncbi:dispanin subfamily A member 2b-like [Strigops habroptila]|uniref:Dispanin subfamily A member 2b-like n=1 Tax=Strigops habroptila TaxID=2489341 RepID=A0A672TK76_STRHB|nr:dispanin subfamily A member 2b-like [Strigops habroptila]